MKRSNITAVGDVHISKLGTTYRVSADVGGQQLWFESDDIKLTPSPEAFVSSLLVPAMSHGLSLKFKNKLCPARLKNSSELMEIYKNWWDWPPISIESGSVSSKGSRDGSKTALCFSGGVDSFYSLLTCPDNIDYLVMVHGFDIELSDQEGADIVYDRLQKIGEQVGVSTALIRTNYRNHPISGKKYKYAFEGALAAIGHLMANVGTLIISSGHSKDYAEIANGSHESTAPLQSSKDFKVKLYGEDYTREEKLRQIASNSLVRGNLRVCQQNLKPEFGFSQEYLNCGECSKCLRTLIPLIQEGGLDGISGFRNTSNLALCIDRIDYLDEYFSSVFSTFCDMGIDPDIELSIRTLIYRSNYINRNSWLGRRGIKIVSKLFRIFHAGG